MFWFLPSVKILENGRRLDVFLTQQILRVGHHPVEPHLPVPSRGQCQKFITKGYVFVIKDGTKHLLEDVSYRIKKGMRINVLFPVIQEPSFLSASTTKQPSFEAYYEDSHLIVLKKMSGVVVHRGAGHHGYTLVDALMEHCGLFLSPGMGKQRPGLVHRLDKNTSGLLLIAKHQGIHEALARQFLPSTPTHQKRAKRLYHALVWNPPTKDTGVIEEPITRHRIKRTMMTIAPQGRMAITHYRVVRRWQIEEEKMGLIVCRLETGRTHQIRVHLRFLGACIVGDPIYGWKHESKTLSQWREFGGKKLDREQSVTRFSSLDGQMLHASGLSFDHPVLKKEMSFFSPLPIKMQKMIE